MAVGDTPEAAELKRWKLDRISRAGTHIMGRVSYVEMKDFWRKSKDPYAAPMNDIPKVVFSKTLKEADWPESTIASGDLAKEIAALRSMPGGEIIAWGLPIGAYDPAWFMSKQHMNPEEAARAFTDLGARTFVAMHWGTFKLTDEPLNEPPARLAAEWQRRGLDPGVCLVPPIGGTLLVGRSG